MPRQYRRKLGARRYVDYSFETLNKAMEAVNSGQKVKPVAKRFGIPRRTFANKVKGHHIKKVGGQTIFTQEEEHSLVLHILKCAEFGMPLDLLDIRMIAKNQSL